MKKSEKQYWFKAKRYGWGWSLPATKQGWLTYGIFFAIWLVALAWLVLPYQETEPPLKSMLLFIATVTLDTAALIYVAFKYGEPPRWRWGKKSDSDKS